MICIKDQLNRELVFQNIPQKIISVVPSITEFITYLDIPVLARTKFCIHPQNEFKNSIKIGGTKKLKIQKIKLLNPDFIIANKEENTQSDIEEISKFCTVYISDINNLNDMYSMMTDIGKIFKKTLKTDLLIQNLEQGFSNLCLQVKHHSKSVLYLIWKDPIMAVAQNTFIDSIISMIGLKNILNINYQRYPTLSNEQISSLKPDYIFLSSEPFPFSTKHISEFKKITPKTKVILVDGEFFSWYGIRLLKSENYFNNLLEHL